MTAISPLESVHKKGLFGDHHKKNENDLLNFTEIRDLSIVQIVQYKNSKIKVDSIEIDNLELSLKTSKVVSNSNTRILWNAPGTWLVVSKKKNIIKNIDDKCNFENFAITDLSHSRAAIQIKGKETKEVLKKGCPINFNEFKKNNSIGTIFNGITIVVDYIEDHPDTFNLFTLRSFGESFYHHITDAALEFGYIGN
jgi:heterotetrameric sarcosine oxidase gamma subunit